MGKAKFNVRSARSHGQATTTTSFFVHKAITFQKTGPLRKSSQESVEEQAEKLHKTLDSVHLAQGDYRSLPSRTSPRRMVTFSGRSKDENNNAQNASASSSLTATHTTDFGQEHSDKENGRGHQNEADDEQSEDSDQDEDEEEEVSIVGVIKAKTAKPQSLNDIVNAFPSVREYSQRIQKQATPYSSTPSRTLPSPSRRSEQSVVNSFLDMKLEPQSVPTTTDTSALTTPPPLSSTRNSRWRKRRPIHLSEDEQRLSRDFLSRGENEKIVELDKQPITGKDLRTLQHGVWLNDEVLGFYFALIAAESGVDGYPRVYSFNTFFFASLERQGPSRMERWMKKLNIFDFDLLLVPIHIVNHWCLAAIDMREHKIEYYDSLGGNNEKCLCLLFAVIDLEYKRQNVPMPTTWTGRRVMHIPAQANGSDCGVFACQFAKYVSKDWPLDFSQANMATIRQMMVTEIGTKKLII